MRGSRSFLDGCWVVWCSQGSWQGRDFWTPCLTPRSHVVSPRKASSASTIQNQLALQLLGSPSGPSWGQKQSRYLCTSQLCWPPLSNRAGANLRKHTSLRRSFAGTCMILNLLLELPITCSSSCRQICCLYLNIFPGMLPERPFLFMLYYLIYPKF